MDVGTREAGSKFIDNLKMLYHVANIGDARSLAIHPSDSICFKINKSMLKDGGEYKREYEKNIWSFDHIIIIKRLR